MNQNLKISIVIPAHNEEEALPPVLAEIVKLDLNKEVIIINDGSTDNTAKEVAKFKDVKIITHPYALGQGASFKDGFSNATGDYILTMDADGQHQAKDIPRLVSEAKKGYDIVVGARNKSQQAGAHRNLANTFYNLLASYVTKFKIQDLTSGMRIMKSNFAKAVVPSLPNGFSSPTTTTLISLKSGKSLKYIPIDVLDRQGGTSKIKIFKDGIRFLIIIGRIVTLFSPSRVFLPISSIFLLSGIIYSLIAIINVGKLPNLGTLLISTGIIIFMIGVVSEQIAQIKTNYHKK